MENPKVTYNDYISADAINKFIIANPNIPQKAILEDHYTTLFYALYRKLRDKNYTPSYTKEEEAYIEATAVLNFCEHINITANFTVTDKEKLFCTAREVLTQCVSALIPRAAP